MTDERRVADHNDDWDKYRIFVIEKLEEQGKKQDEMLQTINDINNRLTTQETKMCNASGMISFAVSSIVSIIGGIIMFFVERVR